MLVATGDLFPDPKNLDFKRSYLSSLHNYNKTYKSCKTCTSLATLIGDFRPMSLRISETVQFKTKVTIDHC